MPHPQISAAPDPSGGVKQSPDPPLAQRSSLSVAGYSHKFEKSAHWSSLLCICLLGSCRHPSCLLDWRGAGVQRRFCHGGITSPTAPFHLHLWDSTMAFGRKRNLFPTEAVSVQPSIILEVPANISLLVLLPPLALSRLGSQ